jgi:uroporphyrinogen-III decarboxylase
MNSQERTFSALRLEKPDRPPMGFFAIDSDTAGKVLGRETYWRAKAKIRIALWEGRRQEVVESLIADGIELYKKLDIIDIVSTFVAQMPPRDYEPENPTKIDDDTWQDKVGRVYKYSAQTRDIVIVHDPTVWTQDCSVEALSWDGNIVPPCESQFEVIDALIDGLGADRFILEGCAPPVSGWLLVGGMERGFMEIAMRPQEVKQIYKSLMDKAIAHNKYYLRPGQHGVLLGDDYSSTKGPMINPAAFRELFVEDHARRISALKKMGYPVVQHSCGNNWDMLDIFVDMGIDCYQAIQASAGMDIVKVQEGYGRKFAVWGGVKTENLVHGSTEDVRNDVRHFMTKVAPNGGCVLGTTHSVCTGTNYDNFMALLDEYSKFI